jgi:hypothetical protein
VKALRNAIYSKLSGSTLETLINGQLYYGSSPSGTRFPYVVFFSVTQTPEKTFTEHYTDAVIQFSVFSATETSSNEAHDISEAVKALYDECALTITGSTLVWMLIQNVNGPVVDDTIQQDGLTGWACHLDFECKTSLN